jgi:hypothetical protein
LREKEQLEASEEKNFVALQSQIERQKQVERSNTMALNMAVRKNSQI